MITQDIQAYKAFKDFLAASPDRQYAYESTIGCALAQFGRYQHPEAYFVSAGSSHYEYRSVAMSMPVRVQVLPSRNEPRRWQSFGTALLTSSTFGEALAGLVAAEKEFFL